MDTRFVLLAALVVAVLLPGSFVVGDFYIEPGTDHRYAITHESTDAFDEVAADLETDEPTPAADLSPETQRAFDELVAETDTGDGGGTGWTEHTIAVCPDTYVVCNAYETPPDFPRHNELDGPTSNTYSLVESADERYIVERQYGGGIGFAGLFIFPIVFFSLVGYGLYLGIIALRHRDTHPLSVLLVTGIGGVVLGLPHLLLFLGRTGSGLFLLIAPLLFVGFAGTKYRIGSTASSRTTLSGELQR